MSFFIKWISISRVWCKQIGMFSQRHSSASTLEAELNTMSECTLLMAFVFMVFGSSAQGIADVFGQLIRQSGRQSMHCRACSTLLNGKNLWCITSMLTAVLLLLTFLLKEITITDIISRGETSEEKEYMPLNLKGEGDGGESGEWMCDWWI